jgi:hypothetical protein
MCFMSRFSSYLPKIKPAFLELAVPEDGVMLEVPAYGQLDTYSCGATAGYALVRTFHKRANFKRFYRAVSPDPEEGIGPLYLRRALRKFRVGTRERRNMKWPDIRECIDQGFLLLIGTGKENPDWQGDHWSVLYGYGRRPKRVYLTNQPGVLWHQEEVPWGQFVRSVWNPAGKALVCWGE